MGEGKGGMKRVLMRWFVFGILLLGIARVVEESIRYFYVDHGHGDQVKVFFVVFGAFISPVLTPVIHLKMLFLQDLLPASVESWIVYAGGRWLLTPAGSFEDYEGSPAPDYADEHMWNMLPRNDTSTAVCEGCHTCKDVGLCDKADAFYIHPTTWYTSASWNAPVHHPVTAYLSQDAIGPQHANVFNIASRIFAPKYRQAAAASFLHGPDHEDSKKAFNRAYEDIRAAFQHYLDHHWDGKRGIIVSGHSQGSLMGERLVDEFFQGKPLQKHLIAAYLPGYTIYSKKYTKSGRTHEVTVCEGPTSTGCVISWRTFAQGGDPSAFLHVPPPSPDDKPICTNPLSWESNGVYMSREHNLGGLDVMHPWTMWEYLRGVTSPRERVILPSLTPNIADAECIDGHLFMSSPARTGYGWGIWPVWHFATFPGANYHTYDYNVFFNNIRHNVAQRVHAFLSGNETQ